MFSQGFSNLSSDNKFMIQIVEFNVIKRIMCFS